METVLSPHLLSKTTLLIGSACLQIEIVSGAQKNLHSNFEGTSLFLGSDPECDLVLSGDHFPPMYAFLLVDSQSVVARYLGEGPLLLVDQKPVGRQRIFQQAHLSAGPFAMNIHVTPSQPQSFDFEDAADTPAHIKSHAIETGIQLIEQASRLLASIGNQKRAEVPLALSPVETSGPHTPSTTLHSTTTADLKLSVGLPASRELPPIWQHICL